MKRTVLREMPDGSVRYVQPYHVSMEGQETVVLCRDDEDYDAMVKVICVCAKRKNVIVIIYAVVSNHSHVAILAICQDDADAFSEEIKRMYSMWFSKKYGRTGIMRKVDVKALFLDSDWYTRNALAYVPRNALDNGCNVDEYPWSGYRAMFSTAPPGCFSARKVAGMTKIERRAIMHTGDNLTDVPWLIDDDNRLIPKSFCDYDYLEQAFEHDQAFFLKTIGGQNSTEMRHKLIETPRHMLTDNEFLKIAEETTQRWFSSAVDNLSTERKTRIIPYLYRTIKTTVPQLSRVFGLSRDVVSHILGRGKPIISGKV
ncbi:MAG: hypothetical protein J6L98_03870 [Bacteroidales bacterium]|nr:hypothetical protein [Bacteroidales bacterium]